MVIANFSRITLIYIGYSIKREEPKQGAGLGLYGWDISHVTQEFR